MVRKFAARVVGGVLPAAVCLLVCPAGLHAQTAPRKPPGKPLARKGRAMQGLDGAWRFQTDPNGTGESLHWERAAPADARVIAVPSLWNTEAAPNYTGSAWYWRSFRVPPTWRGQTVRLRFDAAADDAIVWLNGERLGAHQGGATPFAFDVTGHLHTEIGSENLLTARVSGRDKTTAGLWQSVVLLAHDEAYIEDCFPQASANGAVATPILLTNKSVNTGDAILDARVVAANAPERDVRRSRQNLNITPGRNLTTLLLSFKPKIIHPWSPESPQLYRLQLAFRQEQDVLDTLETTFGFRDFGVRAGAITLNSVPFRPVAIKPLPMPSVVLATTDDLSRARETLRHVKSGGANVVYLDAPPPGLLALADEEGLLVVEGAGEAGTNGGKPDGDIETLRALILRDRAHACILAWNLGAAGTAGVTQARLLDPTRFLLTGTGAATQLWPPGQSETAPLSPPPGLLPAP